MAQMTYEEFSKMNQNSTKDENTSRYTNSPSYFYLADDGDTAIVRFNIADIKDLSVTSRHSVYVNGKRRNVECIRGFNDPVESCPLCASGSRPTFRVYIQLLSYKVENGKITYEPCVWDQPARFRETLKSYFMDYGDLRNIVFKITRHGRKGDTNTTYSLIVANPQMYKNEDYVADFSAFENFNLNRSMVLLKSKDELQYYVDHEEFPAVQQSVKETAVAGQTRMVQNNTADTMYTTVSTPSGSNVWEEARPIRSTYNTPDMQERQQPREQPSQIQRGPRRYTY